MRCFWILGTLVATASFASTSETEPGPDDVADGADAALELYTLPRRSSLVEPTYPRRALTRNREGWVRLDFMVDPNGKPYEIAVTESVGDVDFHKAAVRALERSEFEPARFNGEPLDAGFALYYHFEMAGPTGARPHFVRTYKALIRAIGSGDRDVADERLRQLDSDSVANLYEDAYLHVAKYNYHAKWGDDQQQLEALDRAVGHDTAEKRLPEPLYVSLQRARFGLLVRDRDYQRALETYETLSGYELEEPVLAALATVAGRLETLRDDDRAYSVPGDFGDRFSWSYGLFKDEFLFQDVDGEIEEIKLRCARKFIFLRFDPAIKYKTNPDYQPCHLELIGDPGTTFTLTQL
ncbi:MAG: energy transducer TonB [Gammaproteobacteria bacterium]|nr:energy transducer TonB [Gammaproteobacteria bacterium]